MSVCLCAYSLDDTVVPHILPTLLGVSASAHVGVRYTNVKLVGYLSHWLNAHQQYLGKTFSRHNVFLMLFLPPSFYRYRNRAKV